MSFGGGRSFKLGDLKLKRELEELTRQSQLEYTTLSVQDKTQFLDKNVSQKVPKGKLHPKSKKKSKVPKKNIQYQHILKGEENELREVEDMGEVPPPSPSIDLEPELMRGEIAPSNKTPWDLERGESSAAQGRQALVESAVQARSSAVASIRANVDLSVVMQGKGIVDGDRASKTSTVQSTARVSINKTINTFIDNINTLLIYVVQKCTIYYKTFSYCKIKSI